MVSFTAPIQKDTLIIASGPSLKPYLDFIKENQNSFFIICLSSAISACIKNNIIPDLCMTTDGGYWAGQHLKKLRKIDIPLAMPAEAFCPKALLAEHKILPLIYDDGISKDLLYTQSLECKKAVRNGTVSGTALLFALQYCTGNLYFCGLDMAPQKGFQHCQPNELDSNAALNDSRLSCKETRYALAGLPGGSLDIYLEWFRSFQLPAGNRRVYRVIEKSNRKNSLGQIQDIDLKEFSAIYNKEDSKPNFITVSAVTDKNITQAIELLESEELVEKWKKQLFPLDYVQLSHNPSNTEIQNKIITEWDKLKQKVKEILNEDL